MNSLPTCCMNVDLDPYDLAFPDRIGKDGREFFEAFGLYDVTVRELFKDATRKPNGEIHIRRRCAQLLDNGLCKIYVMRPLVCRKFDCRTRHDCACKGKGIINGR